MPTKSTVIYQGCSVKKVGEMLKYALATMIFAVVAVGVSQASRPVLIEDFEAGVGAWTTSDGIVAEHKPARLCGIYATSESAPDGGQQAGMVEFLEGKNTRARVTIPVNGQNLAENNCTELSMWLRGDGSDNTVSVVLHASYDRAQNPEVDYIQLVSLSSVQWQKLGLRFLGFTNKDGQTLTRDDLPHLTLLQFIKTGTWSPCRFYIDELRAEDGSWGSQEEALELNFRRWSGRVRVQIGCNFGAAGDVIQDSQDREGRVSNLIRELAPCVVRFVLDNYFLKDQEQYDIARLSQHIDLVQRQGAKALICLYAPLAYSEGKPQEVQHLQQIFRTAVKQLVELQAGERWGRYYEVRKHPLLPSDLVTTYDMVNAYNSLANEIIQVDPEAWIGGPGIASSGDKHLSAFLRATDRLDFLSYHFWGAHTPVVNASQLLDAARTGQSPDLPRQLSFEAVSALARWQRRPRPEVFITQAGLNSAATSVRQTHSEYFAGSWLAMTALAAAPYIDKLLYTPLVGERRGLVDEEGRATAVYHAAWLVHTYMPRGSKLCHWLYPDDETVVGAIRTPTANNVVIAYGGEDVRTFTIRVIQAGELVLVRTRKIASPIREIQFTDLPVSTEQTVELTGPGVAVVQFIPNKQL